MNKGGKMAGGTIIAILVVLGAIAYITDFNGVQSYFNKSPANNVPANTQNLNTQTCPSTGLTTVTINTQDALASTATAVVAEYYIYDGETLIASGQTTAAGVASPSLTCGKSYDVILLNSSANTGAYATEAKIDAFAATATVNVKMKQMGGAKILSIENPADPSRIANVTLGAGASKQFTIQFAANATQKAYNKPIILCQANVTSINSVSIGSFSDGTPVTAVASIPKRISASSGYAYYAFEYGKILDPTQGVVAASGTITAQSSVAPATGDAMTCLLVDQATWKKAAFLTLSKSAGFATGPENSETLANVGAADSTAASLYFGNAGGY